MYFVRVPVSVIINSTMCRAFMTIACPPVFPVTAVKETYGAFRLFFFGFRFRFLSRRARLAAYRIPGYTYTIGIGYARDTERSNPTYVPAPPCLLPSRLHPSVLGSHCLGVEWFVPKTGLPAVRPKRLEGSIHVATSYY